MRARRRAALLAALAAGLIAVVAAGVVLAGGGSDQGPVAAGTKREAAPELAGTNPITGEPISLADFEGKPVVINIWASWCPGCRDEAPALRRLSDDHAEAVVLGIDIQDTTEGAREFYREFGWEHPSIFDPNGALAQKLGLFGLPSTYFLNADHEIVTRLVGETDLAGFEQGLAQAKAAS